MIEADDICSILVPILITPTMIHSTIVTPEDPSPAWASTTTYTAGQRAFSATTHRVYESLKDSNTGNDPTVLANQNNIEGVGTWWIDAGPTNKFAMFDGIVSTQTAVATPLTITLQPGYFNAFALFGVDADTITVTVRDAPGGTAIYSYSGPLEGSAPADYYEYFFERFRPQTQFIAVGIDPYNNAEITIVLAKGSGTVKLGMLAIGDMAPIGVPLKGASVDPVDYSSVVTDAYGNTTIKKRVSATGMTISAKCATEDANIVMNNLKAVLGTPVVVVGSEATMYESLTVYGLVSARLVYDGVDEQTVNITVKGLI
ncbi:MAG: hypothetical protein NTX28_07600 [Novosphingobium sp.]|nr:hypothetical protein [Novosphingobium sp.]